MLSSSSCPPRDFLCRVRLRPQKILGENSLKASLETSVSSVRSFTPIKNCLPLYQVVRSRCYKDRLQYNPSVCGIRGYRGALASG
jgi:hypothetical protein